MSIFSRLRSRNNKTAEKVQLMTEVGNSYLSWRGAAYDSDIVRACIRPKVKAIGKLAAKHIRTTLQEDGSVKMDVNPSFYMSELLKFPNKLMTGQQLQEKVATQLCINSNAFILISRNEQGTPVALYPIIPQYAEAKYKEDGTFLRFTLANGRVYEFNYDDIIHLKQDFNENDIFGTPIAPLLTPLLNVVTTTDQGIINAIKNSSVVKWLLKFTTSMRPEDLTGEAKKFAENFLSNADGVGVAATDAKADATQITPTDYVPNALQMDRTEARIYALFNTNEKIVRSNPSEDERSAYFDAEIEPVLRQLSDVYTLKLFTTRQRSFGNSIIFEASAWDSASFSTKLELVQLVDRGALTPNEWRQSFNLAPIDGGDKAIRRLDTAVVENTEKGGKDAEG